jgi:hypothetical protein
MKYATKADQLEDLEQQLADADVALGDARRVWDSAAADALLAAADQPDRKQLDRANDKQRVLFQAVAKLRAEIQRDADAGRAVELVKLRERLAALHTDRQKAVDLATALMHVAHRVFAASIGTAVAGGSFSPRISGMADIRDWPRSPLCAELKDITASLIALGVPHSEAAKEVAASEHAAPVQRAEARKLSAELSELLKRAGLLGVELPPLKP